MSNVPKLSIDTPPSQPAPEVTAHSLHALDQASLFECVFDSSADGLMVISHERKILKCNPAAIKLLNGINPVGRHCYEVIHGLNAHPTTCICNKVLTGKASNRKEIYEPYLDKWLEITSSPILDDDNNVIAMLHSFRDITDLIHAQTKLHENQVRLQLALDAAAAGTWEWDLDSDTLFWDSRSYELFGSPTAKSITTLEAWLAFIHPEDQPTVRETLKHVLHTKYNLAIDYRIITPGNTEHHIRTQAVIIRNDSGKAKKMTGIFLDITEQVTTQQKLIQNSKMTTLGTLISGIGHEINNPTTFIMLNAPLLKTMWETTILPALTGRLTLSPDNLRILAERLPKMLDGIEQGSERIRSVINLLKEYARVAPSDEKRDLDINQVIYSCVGLINAKINHATNNFCMNLADRLPVINGNFQHLEQVIINLIINACEALTSKQQAITIKTYYDNSSDMIIVELTDEGCGIEQQYLKRIKEPFFTTKRDVSGTGLGLSLADHIITDHQGELLIDSAVNKGTKVILSLKAHKLTTE